MASDRRSLVLASASPRRREILAGLGLEFEVVVPQVEELLDGPPEELVVENALRKARAVAEQGAEGALVLGVDTDVALDGRILGKAADPATAREHLRALSARTHQVLSGVALVGPEAITGPSSAAAPSERTALSRSLVTFRELDDDALDLYLRSEEWRDRAGAYAIQGLGSLLVERVEGDFSNVVGLPVRTLLELAPDLRLNM